MKICTYFVLAILSDLLTSTPASAAQAVSGWQRILWFETGWRADTMAIMLDAPPVNPTNPSCNVLDAGYALDPQDPGVRVHEAAIMGAYFSGKRVRIRVDGCVFGKPRVIAVAVQD